MASNTGAGRNDGPIPKDLINQLNAAGSTDPAKVGITAGVFAALGFATVIGFQILRPNNKIVYAPKAKYAEDGKAPPKVSEGFFGWLPPVIKYKEHDLLPLIGLDGVTFLRFVRMMRWMLTAMALVLSVVLMPVDIAYNINHPNNRSQNKLNWINMSNVGGTYLWAHVAMSYVGTVIALGFIWYHYREMVRLRWAYFRSEEYQTSFHARTLMITEVHKKLQSDGALAAVLSQIKMPYPTTEVHIGRRVGHLPDLIEKHNELVRKLERVLAKYLKNPNNLPAKRPTITIGGCAGIGGQKVDAIDYLTSQINKVEAAVMDQRERIAEKKPESYGFASLAAVPYAHAAAKSLKNKKPSGIQIALSPPPNGIIWNNLSLKSGERAKSSFFGFLLLLVLIFLNTLPLVVVSLISNMASLTSISWLGWLKSWEEKSSWSFAAVSGLGAPIIMGIASFFFPLAMRRIGKYRGVQTRYKLDRILVGQLFGFLVISQLLIFSLIGVALSVISRLVVFIEHKDDAWTIIKSISRTLAFSIKNQYLNQSNYWLTWLPLRGYLAIFDLAQVIKLMLVWVQKGLFGRTPRDVREYTKPPVFDYWLYYANFLFMIAVAMIYAPLAPLVAIFAAGCFWLSSFIYKYQLMYVFTTKHETGGMLWRPVVNRLLFCIGFMQFILALAVVLDDFAYLQAIASAPPILMLIAFKIYCTRTFDPKFDWYIPNEAEIASSKIHGGDARHNRLQRRFGHPLLSSKLFTPMVHANVKHLLPQVYRGKIENTGLANVDGRRVEMEQVAGGLKIAAIEEDQLEYDPQADSDNRSIMSGTTMGGFANQKMGTPGSVGPQGDYFKGQYANYIAGGSMRGEEIEMNNVMARDSRDNLLEKGQQQSIYSDSIDGTFTGTQHDKTSQDMYRTYTNGSMGLAQTPGIEGMTPQHPTAYTDPYAQAHAATPGAYLPQTGNQANASQASLGSYGNMLYGNGAAGVSGIGANMRGRLQPTRSDSGFTAVSGQFSARQSPQQQAQRYQGQPQRQATAEHYQAQQPHPRQVTGEFQPHSRQGTGEYRPQRQGTGEFPQQQPGPYPTGSGNGYEQYGNHYGQ